jgi:hypothetical protein
MSRHLAIDKHERKAVDECLRPRRIASVRTWTRATTPYRERSVDRSAYPTIRQSHVLGSTEKPHTMMSETGLALAVA